MPIMPRKTHRSEGPVLGATSEQLSTPTLTAAGRKRGRPPGSTTRNLQHQQQHEQHQTTPTTSVSGRPTRERVPTPNAMPFSRPHRGDDASGTPNGANGTLPTTTRVTRDAAATPSIMTSTAPVAASEPPPKKRRYIPGGAGGGGRFIETDGSVTPNVPRGPRRPVQGTRTPSTVVPQRERSTRIRTATNPKDFEYSSAAAVAAAVAQNEGYKPREERGWEEFHPDLDIEATFMVLRAEEVDGLVQPTPATPKILSGGQGSTTPLREVNPSSTGNTPNAGAEGATVGPETPQKRRPVRPTREASSYFSRMDSLFSSAPKTPKTPQVLPIRNQTAKEKLDLKAPSYRRSDRVSQFERKSFGQARYMGQAMLNVGYQESDEYARPNDRMLKAPDNNPEEDPEVASTIKPEVETASSTLTSAATNPVGRVEYDMDEQDDMWLESLNAERKKNDAEPITREIFEITLTKIEKEWHALEKRIPKPNPKPPQTHRPRSSSAAAVNGEPQAGEEQDSKCAICDDGDCENTNAIVFCDGCDLAVHQECYGVPFIPEGQWLCRKCQLIGRGVPTCIFCPNTDGAFKQTNSSKWAHLLCAMWIPEVSLGNHTFMEPVMDVDKVPRTRWKLTCYICNQKMGACIQCGNKACYQAFHVTCARRSRLYLKMKNSQGALAVLDNSMILKAFCDKHCPPDHAKENDVATATREAKKFYRKTMKSRIWADNQQAALALATTQRNALADQVPEESQLNEAKLNPYLGDKQKGQPGKTVWKLPSGAPVIPQALFDIVEGSLVRFTLRKRKDFVSEACRYWTLKREARRGAALLKRLQLQMETFSSMEITRRNFPSMGPSGKARLARRIEFAETLIKDLEQLKGLSQKLAERERQKLEAAELERDFVDTCYFPVAKLFCPIIEKALALDKGVFEDGLEMMQGRLEELFYTTVLPFAHDLSDIINAGINSDFKMAESASDDAVVVSNSKVSYEDPRQRRTLGKRILKSVQPQLEAALRMECEISSKPVDAMLKELEGMLESSLEFRINLGTTAATQGAGDGSSTQEEATADVVMMDAPSEEITVAHIGERPEEEPTISQGDAMEVDADGEANDDSIEVAVAVEAPLQETLEPSTEAAESESKEKADAAPASSDTPPATNGYLAAPAPPAQPAPPTPPQSVGSLLGAQTADPLSEGGVLWHLKEFSPKGTSLIGDRWSGIDALRSLSEDLSDIDDGELEGLGIDVDDSIVMASPNGAAGLSQGEAPAVDKTKGNDAKQVNKKKTRSSARRR